MANSGFATLLFTHIMEFTPGGGTVAVPLERDSLLSDDEVDDWADEPLVDCQRVIPPEIQLHILEIRIADGRRDREELLVSLRRMSVVSKRFLKPCQRELFRIIALYPPPRNIWNRPVESRNALRRFDTLLVNKPELGSYVRRLEYHLPPSSWALSQVPDATCALNAMVNLEEFSLECPGMYETKFLLAPGRDGSWNHANAVLSLMNSRRLKVLTVTNVVIPRRLFAPSPALETLRLIGSPLYHSTECPEDTQAVLPTIRAKNLVLCDGEVPFWLQELADLATKQPNDRRYDMPFSLSSTETLEVCATGTSAVARLLAQASSLQQLHFHTMPTFSSSHALESPLMGLNSGSFMTLRVLSFDIVMAMERSQPIVDPYQGLFRDAGVFTSLTRLEEVTINITISAYTWGNCPVTSFGAQWGEMDGILVPGAEGWTPFACLKRVTLYVLLNTTDENAEEFIGLFRERVIDVQFGGLRKLEDDRALSLILDVDNWDSRDDFHPEFYYERRH